MRRLELGTGALVGFLLTLALTGILYLGDQVAGLPFVPFDLFNWISRELPGDIVTFGIDTMIDAMLFLGVSVADSAKTAERAMAIIMFLVGGSVAGALYFAAMKWRQAKADPFSGLVMAALFGLPQIAISLIITQSSVSTIVQLTWLAVLYLVWGLALSMIYARLAGIEQSETASAALISSDAQAEESGVEKLDRRTFLVRLGAATATITVVSGGLGAILATQERRRDQEAIANTTAHGADESTEHSFPNANDPVVPVPGTRPEYTPIKDHYKVFLQTEPTVIEGSTWLLPITGLVENPLMLSLDDLRNNYEPHSQYVTITCISGRVGTGLISTTQWTGARAQDVLADAGLREEAGFLLIESGDGFFETVDLDLIAADERIMFCYEWDGTALPVDHGFPLRIWIPDLYGMKQPKWITSMEVIAEDRDGYWVERNWDKVARVKTTSVIDTVAVDHIIENGDQRLVPIGGIAYSGDRGISAVEVRVDGGPWEMAELRSPLSETTWVIWRYEWPFAAGDHTFEVRCAEADGTPQIEESTDNRPDGATGIHSVDASL